MPGEVAAYHYRQWKYNYGHYLSNLVGQPPTKLLDGAETHHYATALKAFLTFGASFFNDEKIGKHQGAFLKQLSDATPVDPETGKFIPIKNSGEHWDAIRPAIDALSVLSKDKPISEIVCKQKLSEYRKDGETEYVPSLYHIKREGFSDQIVKQTGHASEFTHVDPLHGVYKINIGQGKFTATHYNSVEDAKHGIQSGKAPKFELYNLSSDGFATTPEGRKVNIKEALGAFSHQVEKNSLANENLTNISKNEKVESAQSVVANQMACASLYQLSMNLLNDIHVNHQGLSTGGVEKSVNYASSKA